MSHLESHDGIQQLLVAEQEAQKIIQDARAAKTARLRQAKQEAEREVAEYRAQRENDYRRRIDESGHSSGAVAARLDIEAQASMKDVANRVNVCKAEVVDFLLKASVTV